VEIWQFRIELEGDCLELSAFLQVEIVQEVFIVLKEVQVPSLATVAESVHTDDLFPQFEALFAGFPGEVGPLVLFPLPFETRVVVFRVSSTRGFPFHPGISPGVFFGPGMGSGKVFHVGFVFELVCYFGHSLEVILIAVVESVGEEVVKLMFEVLFDVQIGLMPLFELGNAENTLLDLLLDLLSVQLYDRLGRTQETLVVVHLVQQKLQLGHDIVDSVHLDDEL
jgi:hypothetical protein